MIYALFSCTTPNGNVLDDFYGGETVMACFVALHELVLTGWQLHDVCLIDPTDHMIPLKARNFSRPMDDLLVEFIDDIQRLFDRYRVV